MSLIRRRYAVSRCWRLLGVLFSALLALALFNPSVSSAQEVKQIKLTEKHLQSFIAVSEDLAKLFDGANQDKLDEELEAQAEAMEPIRTNWTRSWKLRPRLLSRETVLRTSPSSTMCRLIFR